jgi:hypothetical protein
MPEECPPYGIGARIKLLTPPWERVRVRECRKVESLFSP